MLRKILSISLCLILSLSANAQRRKANRAKEPTPEELALQARQERLERKLQATEQVIFIDSVIVPRSQVLSSLQLSSESGTIESYSRYFNLSDSMDCTVYRSQLGNSIIYSQPQKDGYLRLYSSDLIGTEWTAASRLQGLGDNQTENYPFMLNDGVTLYFAAQGEESLGGYDIFVTRYDADSHTFLTPENIGMPFNSEANDYLYVVDEYHQLGWFVTDRGQQEGNVCIYCFIPNSSRQIYNQEEIGIDRLRSLANINSIHDTWTDQKRVKEAMNRLVEMKRNAQHRSVAHDFDFVINDRITYTTISQFRNESSRQKAKWWVEANQEANTIRKELDALRSQYASGDSRTRQSLAPQILILEQKYEKLISDIKLQEKAIRQIENQ